MNFQCVYSVSFQSALYSLKPKSKQGWDDRDRHMCWVTFSDSAFY